MYQAKAASVIPKRLRKATAESSTQSSTVSNSSASSTAQRTQAPRINHVSKLPRSNLSTTAPAQPLTMSSPQRVTVIFPNSANGLPTDIITITASGRPTKLLHNRKQFLTRNAQRFGDNKEKYTPIAMPPLLKEPPVKMLVFFFFFWVGRNEIYWLESGEKEIL